MNRNDDTSVHSRMLRALHITTLLLLSLLVLLTPTLTTGQCAPWTDGSVVIPIGTCTNSIVWMMQDRLDDGLYLLACDTNIVEWTVRNSSSRVLVPASVINGTIITFDQNPSNGELYIATSNSTSGVMRIDRSGIGPATKIATCTKAPTVALIATTGEQLIVLCQSANPTVIAASQVLSVNPTTGASTIVLDTMHYVSTMTFDATTNELLIPTMDQGRHGFKVTRLRAHDRQDLLHLASCKLLIVSS